MAMILLTNANSAALIIGIDLYNYDDLDPLPSCKKDAEDLYQLFSKLDYTIFENAPIIGSSLDSEYGWVKVREAIGNFFSDAKPGQTLIFYFSGHGLPHGEEVYLATPQTEPKKPAVKGFALSDLSNYMNSSKSRRIVSIIDACYSGAARLPDSKMKSKTAAKKEANMALTTYDRIWKRIPKAEGRYLLLSSQAYGQSYAIGNANSLYTTYLIEGLNGVEHSTDSRGLDIPGSMDENGNITPETLHNYIRHKVGEVSDQIPRLKVDKASDIVLAISDKNVQYSCIRKWGESGNGDGQFSQPEGIAIDSLSNVYVTDASNNCVQKFDSEGNFITKWGSFGAGDGQFRFPYGVTIDPKTGWVYVTDEQNNRIQKFDSKGNFITKWGSFGAGDGQFNRPDSVTIDPKTGLVYVADFPSHNIQKFDGDGKFIRKWGEPGTGDGQFNMASGIAIDSTSCVYVGDYYNNRIQKFDSEGNFITKWGRPGTGDGQFRLPTDIAVDPVDNVYIVDHDNNRIQKFDSKGNFITKWGRPGTGDGRFNLPEAIAIDSKTEYIFVVDLNNNRIQVFAHRSLL